MSHATTPTPKPSPESQIPHALAHRLAFLLKRTQIHFARVHSTALSQCDLTEAEFVLLTLICADNSVPQSELGQRLFIDRTSIVALVDSLESKGLVVRQRSQSDRRAFTVTSTPAGHDRLADAERVAAEAEVQFLARLSPEEHRALMSSLRILAEPDSQL